jgi:hypothetical protein
MNEEKDRYGESIRLLDRAREDVYFAQNDRELLENLKHRLERARQRELEHPLMRCPECAVSLDVSRVTDLSVRRCSA